MVTTLRAKFDGKVIVPVGPIDLPVDRELTFQVDVESPQPPVKSGAQRLAEKLAAHHNSDLPAEKTGLQRLLEIAESFQDDPGLPADFSEQHDHYLYGTPKRENP